MKSTKVDHTFSSDERLHWSEEDYRRLVMHADDGICRLDSESKIRFANPCMVTMLGYAEGERLEGRNFTDIVVPSNRRKVLKALKRRRLGFSERYEASLLRKDGSAFPAALSSVPLFDEGEFFGSFATIKDITRQSLLLERLASREARLKDLIDRLPAAICEISKDASVLYVNDTARALLCLPRGRLPPRLSLLRFIPEYARPRLTYILGQALADGARKPFAMEVIAACGATHPALWNAAPVDRRDRDSGFHVVIVDIKEALSTAFVQDDEFLASYGLTAREISVAKLLAVGLLYKEVAARLHISMPTVRTHAMSLYRKIDIHSRGELVDIFVRKQTGFPSEDTLIKLIKRSLLLPL
jgi:PAS domain S-box-containing protein